MLSRSALLLLLVSGLLASAASVQAQPAAALQARIERYEALHRDTQDRSLLWLLTEAYAEAGDRTKALAALRQVADFRMGFVPGPGSALARLSGDPEYDRLAARMARQAPYARRAREAFVLRSRHLVAEGLAYDPAGRRLLVGDMQNRQVLQVLSDGRVRLFASGLPARPLGMAVDATNNLVWIAATENFWSPGSPRSELLGLDLRTGRIVRRASGDVGSLNDVAVGPGGEVYATDSLGGAVARLRPGASSLELVTAKGAMSYPNGLALTPDGRALYVAQGISLRRVDVDSGEVTSVSKPAELATFGVDGLYWKDGDLIAVQNGGTPGRVLRLKLTPAGDAVSSFDVLEAGRPDFDIPTTGAIGAGRFYFLVNAQIDHLRDDGVFEPAGLQPVRILELPL